MKLTRTNIHAAFNCGSPNRKQCSMIGVRYPLKKGWLNAMIGTEVSDEWYAQLCSLRKIRPATKFSQPTEPVLNVPQGKVATDLFSPQTPEEYANEVYEREREQFT